MNCRPRNAADLNAGLLNSDDLMDVVLKNLAKHASGLKPAFQKWFKISPKVVGANLVIKSRDARKAFVDRRTLLIHPPVTLVPGAERSHAESLVAQIPTFVDRYRPPAPDEIRIQSGFGYLSEMHEILARVTVEHPTNLTNSIADRLLPAMVRAYGARYVAGVSIDAEYQQACMSFIKAALLSERYGIDKASSLVKERNALAGVLPHGLTVVSYVDVLTRLSPILFTLPVDRGGCTWHFYNEGAYLLSKSSADGVVQQFMTNFSPLADSSHYLGLSGIGTINNEWILHLLRFVTEGVNTLMSFLNDPRNFAAMDGSANFLKQIQAHSAVQLIFADVNALNYSTFAHNRISYTMSALDKLANLRANLGGGEEAMQKFASFSQSEHLKHLISAAVTKFGYADIGKSFAAVINRCYGEIHKQMAKQCHSESCGEAERLDRIWMQRNVRHGTFLKKNQFERLFFEADGTIAATIGTLPFLLLLGLISNPKEFLRFRPHVGD